MCGVIRGTRFNETINKCIQSRIQVDVFEFGNNGNETTQSEEKKKMYYKWVGLK